MYIVTSLTVFQKVASWNLLYFHYNTLICNWTQWQIANKILIRKPDAQLLLPPPTLPVIAMFEMQSIEIPKPRSVTTFIIIQLRYSGAGSLTKALKIDFSFVKIP